MFTYFGKRRKVPVFIKFKNKCKIKNSAKYIVHEVIIRDTKLSHDIVGGGLVQYINDN